MDEFLKWKNEWLTNLAKAVLGSQLNENLDTQQLDYVSYFRLIKFLREKVKSGYSSNINISQSLLNAKIYIVNRMIESKPDDIITKHLTAFGYGFETTETDEIKKLLERGYEPIILPQPFRESFYISMKDYYAKVPKAIDFRLYLYFTPI